MNQWFVCENEKVTGPFTSDDVKSRAASGLTVMDALVWGRAQPHWMSLSQWLKELPTLQQALNVQAEAQMWHYAIQGDAKGPMPRQQLIDELKRIRTKDEVLLWTKGMKAWADLYEFHDILDELGMNKREHERAPIAGSVVLKVDNVEMLAILKTVSAGGFGAVDLKTPLAIGQTVGVQLSSEQLSFKISAKATVQYISERGFYGFRFANLNMEGKTIIMEFIRRTRTNVAVDTAA